MDAEYCGDGDELDGEGLPTTTAVAVAPKYPWMWPGEPVDEKDFVRWRDQRFVKNDELLKTEKINMVEVSQFGS